MESNIKFVILTNLANIKFISWTNLANIKFVSSMIDVHYYTASEHTLCVIEHAMPYRKFSIIYKNSYSNLLL